ncbi:hypothetical protein ABZP36_001622 [Zizania latifolia]
MKARAVEGSPRSCSPPPSRESSNRGHGYLLSPPRRRLPLPRPPLEAALTPPPLSSPTRHASLLLRLQSCPALEEARRLHAALLVVGHRHGTVLVAQLVRVYAKLGDVANALRMFDEMLMWNSFAWNAVIKGFVYTGRFSEALEMLWEMVRDGSVVADRFTLLPVIKACAALGAVEQGRKVREVVVTDIALGNARPNVFVQCAVVDMFAKCGCLDEARNIFESMQVRDLAAWTAIIGGTVHAEDWLEVVDLFNCIRSEGYGVDSVIATTVILACGKVGGLWVGIALHGCAVKSGVSDDICVSNALVDMYCKCSCIEWLIVFSGLQIPRMLSPGVV